MDLNKRIARTAGLLYLIVIVTGIFSLGYVPSQITVQGDALATVNNIMAAKSLFRLGIAGELIMYTVFLILPFTLYKLLQGVDRNAALFMVVFAVVQVPIGFVNTLHHLDALTLLSGAPLLRTFTPDQLNVQVLLSLNAYRNGLLVSNIFWGLWLLPFGYLVFKSGALPRILGVLLMVGCFGYLTDFFGRLFFPGYAETIISSLITVPGSVGEFGICLWLVIIGANVPAHNVD